MSYRHALTHLAWVFLLAGCARQTTPTGGPKDETPPVLIQSNPVHKQTNVSRGQLELTFDELIQINNAREQIIIVPPVGKKFEVTARKNRVLIELNAELQENTTYSINFREAVQDLTEKNSAKNLKLAFSTGDYIDSLAITGRAYELLKGTPASEFTVAVTPLTDTFNIFKHAAQYFTIADKEGKFAIENLKPDNYFIYAFNDKNKNLIVDSRSELYGFLSNSIELIHSLKDIEIAVVRLDMRELNLISAKPFGNYFLIRTTKGLVTCNLTTLHEDIPLTFDQPEFSTVRIFNTIPDRDSIQVHFNALDSIQNQLDTTFYLKFNKESLTKEKFNAKVDWCRFLENKQNLVGQISLSKPFSKFIYDSLVIRTDTLNTLTFSAENFTWNTTYTRANFSKRIPPGIDFKFQPAKPAAKRSSEPGQNRRTGRSEPKETTEPIKADLTRIYNQLIIPQGTILSIDMDTATTILATVTIVKPETSSTILAEVETQEENILLQLLDKSYNIIEQSVTKKSKFENLTPGSYMLRLIIDKNKNGKWDAGNYFLKQQPEPVLFYRADEKSTAINTKSNWEVGPLFIKY